MSSEIQLTLNFSVDTIGEQRRDIAVGNDGAPFARQILARVLAELPQANLRRRARDRYATQTDTDGTIRFSIAAGPAMFPTESTFL